MRALILSLTVALLGGCSASDPQDPPPVQPEATPEPAPPPPPPLPPLARELEWPGTPNVRVAAERYFAGQPSEEGLRHAARAGVREVLNLRDDDPAAVPYDEAALCAELGLRYTRLPINGKAFTQADAARFAQALDVGEGPLLIHCKSGNRVGALYALYLARAHALGKDDALKHGYAAGLFKAPTVARAETLLDESPR